MNNYEQKQEERRERLLRAAERAAAASDAAFQRARGAVAGIPLGQPILVGHHSEKRHRAALARQDSGMRRGVELDKLAQRLRGEAFAVGTAGISSDDPEAVEKLDDKAADLEARRELMKRANKIWKAAGYATGGPAALAAAVEAGELPTALVARAMTYIRFVGVPFPSYALQYIGARIRSAKARATQLQARAEAVTRAAIERGDGEGPRPRTFGEGERTAAVVENLEDNRVELRFTYRLDTAEYKRVRSYGFLWSPTRKAFVRKFTGQGVVEMACRAAREVTTIQAIDAKAGV